MPSAPKRRRTIAQRIQIRNATLPSMASSGDGGAAVAPRPPTDDDEVVPPPGFHGTLTTVQRRLAREVTIQLREQRSCVLRADVGIGKTLVAGAAARRLALQEGARTLILAIAPSASMARQQAVEYGVSDPELQAIATASEPLLRRCLVEWAPGAPPVTATLTRDAFRVLMRPPPDGTAPILRRIADGARVERVVLLLDEAATCVRNQKSKVVEAVERLRGALRDRLTILGMAADPSQSQSPRERETMIKRLYGLEAPPVVQDTAEERREFRATTLWQGERADAPRAPLAILLKPDERELGELQDAILGAVLFLQPASNIETRPMPVPNEPPADIGWNAAESSSQTLRAYLHNVLGGLEAQQFLLNRICYLHGKAVAPDHPVRLGGAARSEHMHRVARVSAGRVAECERAAHFHTILAFAATRGARRKAREIARQARARAAARGHGEGRDECDLEYAPYGLHDVTAQSEVERRECLQRVREAAAGNEQPQLALINKAQMRGSNEFAKGFTHTVVFGGPLTDAEWDQFHGRVGRRCPPAVGDVFPTRIEGTHVSIKEFDDIRRAIAREPSELDEVRARLGDADAARAREITTRFGADAAQGLLKLYDLPEGREPRSFWLGGETLVERYHALLCEREAASPTWIDWAYNFHYWRWENEQADEDEKMKEATS